MFFWIFRYAMLGVVLCGLLLPTAGLLAARLEIGSAGGFLGEVVEPTGLEKKEFSEASGILIKNILRIVGLIFLLLMVYGGYLWMTARGEEDQIKRGRNTIVAAIIGISVVVGAYAITFFITSRLVEKVGGPGAVDAGGVGDQPLGCCVIDIGATEACRIDTETECNRIADNLEARDDESHARQWIANINAVSCQKFCE